MHLSNIRNYLSDNGYNINIYKNSIYINHYKTLEHASSKMVIVIFKDFKMHVSGNNLVIVKMVDDEILFNGSIESINFIYEKNN